MIICALRFIANNYLFSIYFRDHRHARQQCTLAGRVRHARTCFHTHDAALCAGHEQQPERGDEQCEGTSGMVNMQPARH